MCKGTGRTPSATTTTSPIRRAAADDDVPGRRPAGPRSQPRSEPRQRSARWPGAVSALGAASRPRSSPTHLNNPIRPEYVEPLARCAPAGPTKSFMWHGYEIRQYPGYVVFLFDSGTRIIHLDGKPHLPAAIKLWNGDSRGRWEGNTLIVDVTNNNSKARLARTGEFASDHATHRRALHLRLERRTLHLRGRLHRPDRVHAAFHRHHSEPPHYRHDPPGRLEQRHVRGQSPRRRARHRGLGAKLCRGQRESRRSGHRGDDGPVSALRWYKVGGREPSLLRIDRRAVVPERSRGPGPRAAGAVFRL